MEITNHCRTRMKQRGVSEIELDLINQFGKANFLGHDRCRLTIPRKVRKKLTKKLREIIEVLEDKSETYLIKNDKYILTVAKTKKRFKKDLKRLRRQPDMTILGY